MSWPGVVPEGQYVAIAGEALAKLVRKRQAVLRRPQQNLGGTQRASAQYHHIRGDGNRRRLEFLPPHSEHLALHDPLIAFALDPADGDLRKYLRAVIRSIRQVVHDQGVFGGIVTAANTITAICAFVLLHADMVRAFDREVDVDGCPVELLAQMLGGLLEGTKLGKFRARPAGTDWVSASPPLARSLPRVEWHGRFRRSGPWASDCEARAANAGHRTRAAPPAEPRSHSPEKCHPGRSRQKR